jgi:hypothetical protein
MKKITLGKDEIVSITTRGGLRSNSGAKKLYGEQTVQYTKRVPKSHYITILELVENYLKPLKIVKNDK